MTHHDEQTHTDQDLVSDGDPTNRDIEQHDEFASARGFMPLTVPGMGVPHPGAALASAEHLEEESPAPQSDEPSREETNPGLERR